jgi:hypothetical protein
MTDAIAIHGHDIIDHVSAHFDAIRLGKIERLFWCGVFGELYGGAVETRSNKDLPEVLAWIKGEGRTI